MDEHRKRPAFAKGDLSSGKQWVLQQLKVGAVSERLGERPLGEHHVLRVIDPSAPTQFLKHDELTLQEMGEVFSKAYEVAVGIAARLGAVPGKETYRILFNGPGVDESQYFDLHLIVLESGRTFSSSFLHPIPIGKRWRGLI